jgi:hypothetical protein
MISHRPGRPGGSRLRFECTFPQRSWTLNGTGSTECCAPIRAEQDDIVARLVDTITDQMVNVTNTVVSADGPTGMHRWTSNRLLAAESALVDAAQTEAVFVPPAGDVVPEFGDRLSVSQRAAALGVAASTRQLDVLVGPAGVGQDHHHAGTC